MALFLSTFTNKIDTKGRVSVPAQFRNYLTQNESGGVIVYESFVNPCLEGCNVERIKKLSESIDDLDPFSLERHSLATALLGGSTQLMMDGDGRIILPETLLKKAKIKDSAIFVGKGSTFEIWGLSGFEEYMQNARKQAKDKLNLLRIKHDK